MWVEVTTLVPTWPSWQKVPLSGAAPGETVITPTFQTDDETEAQSHAAV